MIMHDQFMPFPYKHGKKSMKAVNLFNIITLNKVASVPLRNKKLYGIVSETSRGLVRKCWLCSPGNFLGSSNFKASDTKRGERGKVVAAMLMILGVGWLPLLEVIPWICP